MFAVYRHPIYSHKWIDEDMNEWANEQRSNPKVAEGFRASVLQIPKGKENKLTLPSFFWSRGGKKLILGIEHLRP